MPQWTIISLSGCCQLVSGGAAYHPLQWKYLQCLSQPCKSQSLGGETVWARKNKQKNDSAVLFFKSQWLEEEGFDLHASECKTRLWDGCLLRRQFPKRDLLAANLTGLASKFTRGQKQPKRSLKFVFWSTQAAFPAAIKHKRMHLQRKNKIICLERGSAALVVNGLLTHPVNLPCLLLHTHTPQRQG